MTESGVVRSSTAACGKPARDQIDFEVGYIAAQYLLGVRGAALGVGMHWCTGAAERLLSALRHPERAVRAQGLAAPLGRLVAALEEREV